MIIKVEKNIPIPAGLPVENSVPIPSAGLGKLPVDPETGLNTREDKFVDAVLNAPKGSLAKSVQKIYAEEGTDITLSSAAVRASELRKRSAVMSILGEAANEAEESIVEIARYSKSLGKSGGKEGASYAGVALSANKEILDRVHGKAKQSIDVTTRSVTINMDLTQSLSEGDTL